jgi:hypothetical protein
MGACYSLRKTGQVQPVSSTGKGRVTIVTDGVHTNKPKIHPLEASSRDFMRVSSKKILKLKLLRKQDRQGTLEQPEIRDAVDDTYISHPMITNSATV